MTTKREAARTMQLQTVLLLFVVLGRSTADTQLNVEDPAIQKKVTDAITYLDKKSECFHYKLTKVGSGVSFDGSRSQFSVDVNVTKAPTQSKCPPLNLVEAKSTVLVLKINETPYYIVYKLKEDSMVLEYMSYTK